MKLIKSSVFLTALPGASEVLMKCVFIQISKTEKHVTSRWCNCVTCVY